MSYIDTEGPPTKKRRFFTEEPDVLDTSLANEESLPDEINALSRGDGKQEPNLADGAELQNTAQSQRDRHHEEQTVPELDRETLENFVGVKVPPDVFNRLRVASGNNMERAVNMYLDGTWKAAATASGSSRDQSNSRPLTINAFTKPATSGDRSDSSASKVGSTKHSKREAMPDYRYIGAFGVGGWATRSGSALIKHGEAVRIERQKIQPKTLVGKGSGKSAVAQNVPKANSAAARRVDVIVRFTNSRGEEVGRLPRECANWVSTLIDQKVCRFEGTCVYAPERIKTNDTIFLQLRCSLLRTAFDNASFKLSDNRTTGLFEVKETSEEKELRLRQVGLVKLFEEVNLLPSTTSATTTKHKRDGLLQAAEVAEQYENQQAKKAQSNENDEQPASSDEAEDGKELEQDQLDALYKKAQSIDFDAPAAEPADTFAMDLRHYQKQALYWMIAKEKDEINEAREISMHPLWEEYTWPLRDMEDKELVQVVGQEKFYVNPYSGELSLNFPVQEQHCLGGILADEMGLGKTIEMMSLVHSHRSEIAIRCQRQSGTTPTSVNNLPRLPTR
jgi:DNA repair protein RAD5